MTREEFESILEECFIEGYNTAIEDIQEDILDEEAYDLEDEYEYYTEEKMSEDDKDEIQLSNDLAKAKNIGKTTRGLGTRLAVLARSKNLQKKYPNIKEKYAKKFNKNFLRHPIDTTKLVGVDRIMTGKTPVAALSKKEKGAIIDYNFKKALKTAIKQELEKRNKNN